ALTIDSFPSDGFLAALSDAGLPEGFSVARQPQVVPSGLIADIAGFIRVFDRVTGREAWRAAALSDAPPIAQARRREVCFFSAWDFHLPPEGGFQLIEFNDNGSGFLFASIINALFYDVAELEREKGIAPPASISAFRATIAGLVEREANAFFVNRSTDFFCRSDAFAALRQAYASGGLYAAPNPFTYVVRSDKGLMAQLSSPDRDGALGIEADERRTLSAHVPETHVLNEGDADILAERKADFVFKPRRGFASRGLMDSAALGRARLRRLLR